MLILSNSLTETADEGGLKLASSLVKRIKTAQKETCVVTYERQSALGDVFLPVNKLMLNRQLISLICKHKQPVLYIPFPAPSLSMALRIWIVSLFARWGLKVMLIRQFPMEKTARILLEKSKAELIVFSEKAKDFYTSITNNRITYVKTGVDTKRFCPVSPEKTRLLKERYGFDSQKPIVLHVGHMKEGRNVRQLLKLGEKYQVVLVISTLAKERQDESLREELLCSGNIRIIDGYVPNIEEIYQMCDVYFFPVCQTGHCIDVPLSCMEAAACGKPVVTTDYGEMRQLIGKPGFYRLESFDADVLNHTIEHALSKPGLDVREAVLAYDWDHAVRSLTAETENAELREE